MKRAELVAYLDEYLKINEIKDYGPQGLQIEGTDEVDRVIGLVDSALPCVEAAIARQGELMLVHHGIFWGGARRLAGGYGALVRRYLETNLNLYAAHLALDAHPEVGNNAQLAFRLGFRVSEWWGQVNGVKLAALAERDDPIELDDLVRLYRSQVGEPSLVLDQGRGPIRRLGIMSGSGSTQIEAAAALGCDAFLTGETSHAHYYEAENAGIHVIYGGHYASETVGVKALGQHLADKFDLHFEFVDLPTGL